MRTRANHASLATGCLSLERIRPRFFIVSLRCYIQMVALSSVFRIFPVTVLGSWDTTVIVRGTL